MNQPTVSIYLPTFNHEAYVVRALDSILMQQTDFSYEVLIGEDCSTDTTRQVLEDWQKNHPDPRFHFFFRQENMHRQPVTNALDLKQRCTGKYIICLEGDDYWTDPLKLQTQVDFLESHPDYYAVAHNCIVVGADSEPNGETYPQCHDSEYTFRHYANDILPGQFTTLLSRNYMTDPELDRSLLQPHRGPGDRNLYFTLLYHGRIHCIQQTMSAYRHIAKEGSSYSATVRYRYDTEEFAHRCRLEYAYRHKDPQGIRCAEHLYLRNVRNALQHRHIGLKRALADLKHMRHKPRQLLLLLKRDLCHKLLRKELSF